MPEKRIRPEQIHLRLAPAELAMLEAEAARRGLSRVQLIRLLIREAAAKA
jgi:predicted DNA binding CopG/RHH family protein